MSIKTTSNRDRCLVSGLFLEVSLSIRNSVRPKIAEAQVNAIAQKRASEQVHKPASDSLQVSKKLSTLSKPTLLYSIHAI